LFGVVSFVIGVWSPIGYTSAGIAADVLPSWLLSNSIIEYSSGVR